MAKIDFRLRINGPVSDDQAKELADLAQALSDAGARAGTEHSLDLGGYMAPPIAAAPPAVESQGRTSSRR